MIRGIVVLGSLVLWGSSVEGQPYQATGIKIGEITDTQAIIWARLTRNAERNSSDAPMVKLIYEKQNPGSFSSFEIKVFFNLKPN